MSCFSTVGGLSPNGTGAEFAPIWDAYCIKI